MTSVSPWRYQSFQRVCEWLLAETWNKNRYKPFKYQTKLLQSLEKCALGFSLNTSWTRFVTLINRWAEKLTLQIHSSISRNSNYKKTDLLRWNFCGGCKKWRYMSSIAVFLQTVTIHQLYCSIQGDRRYKSSLLRRTIAAGWWSAAICMF